MKGKNKEKAVICWMTAGDHERFVAGYKNTIYRSMGEYARKLLLGIPPTVVYRNRSLDDLVEIAVLLRRDLVALLSKGSLTVAEKESLTRKITNLEDHFIQLSERCSQE